MPAPKHFFVSRPLSRRRVVAFALATFCVASTSLTVATAGGAVRHSSLPSEKSLVASVTKAIASQVSVHFKVASTNSKTKQTELVSEDAGKTNGLETFTQGTAVAHLRLTKKAAYLSGNSKGLSTIFGLPTADLKLVGTKWILVASGTTQYTDISAGGTIATLAAGLLPTSSVKAVVSSTTLSNKKVTALTWTEKSSSATVHIVLYVDPNNHLLPIQLNATETGYRAVTTFSHWGETITVTVPKSTISASKLTG